MNKLLLSCYDGDRNLIEREFQRGTDVARLRYLALYEDDEATIDGLRRNLRIMARGICYQETGRMERVHENDLKVSACVVCVL